MKLRFFKIPVADPVILETELNVFITQHRITHIDKQFVADGVNSFLSICVTWLDSERALADSLAKIDLNDPIVILSCHNASKQQDRRCVSNGCGCP